jgi:uncharacterized protein YbcV (DUF1398 family)
MFTLESIDHCAANVRSYPELVANMRRIGMHSYTVDVASQAMVYRSLDGDLLQRAGRPGATPVTAAFSAEGVKTAIRRSQQGETDYETFMQEIHAAGVRRYEAVIAGPRPRVIYFGADGFLEEPVPL